MQKVFSRHTLLVFTATLAPLLASLSGCNSSDIGSDCPQLLGDSQAVSTSDDPTITVTQNVVGIGLAYENCASLICIAAQGKSGYCSDKCLDDSACPAGFSCQIVQDVGSFAGQKFCAWKRCQSRSDCGAEKDFCCTQVAGTTDSETFKLCAFSTDGKCP